MHNFARGWAVVGVIALLGCTELKRRDGDLGPRDWADAGAGRAGSAADGGKAGAGTGGRAGGAAGRAGSAGESEVDASTSEPAPNPAATSFVVKNTGEAPLLLGSTCYGRWLTLEEDDREIRYDETCTCQCGSDVCGCPGACPNGEQVLMPGLTAEQPWDGVARVVQPSECFEPHVPARGTELTATACWGVSGGVDYLCSSTDFAYGEAAEVQLEAAAEPAGPFELSLTLTNATGAPIEIVTNRCNQQAWFKLDMGESLSATTFCPCGCNAEYKPEGCPVCGGCAEDETQTLAVGESATLDWDGQFFYTYESTCSERYTFPLGTRVNGKLCWRTPGETEERCVSVQLQPGSINDVSISAN